ncbi:hypothetical protein [Empedobacter falsenii]
MLKIKNIEIIDFWGSHRIYSEFHNDVNIFIGRNGTGKTTFINLLQAVLCLDLELLYSLQFTKVIINLKNNNSRRKIEVRKIEKDFQYNTLEYKIGSKKFELPILSLRESKLINKNNGRLSPSFYRQINEVRQELSHLINVSYLSVSREKIVKDEYRERRREDIYNSIDNRLEELITELQAYQLQLETELSKHSKKFQENVLRTMLFNEEFDNIKISEPIKLDIRKTQIGLKQAYRVLGILDEVTSEAIERHIEAIKKASENISKVNENNDLPLFPDDVTPITLLRRTNRMIELSNDLEKNKKEIFKRLD